MTKDADKMICCLYKEFLQRRKLGNSKSDSGMFKQEYFQSDPFLSTWHPSDVSDTITELKEIGFLKIWLSGNFELTTKSISYMENRFKNGLVELTDLISKFIP